MLIWLKKSTVLTCAKISLRHSKTFCRSKTQHKGKKRLGGAGTSHAGHTLTASHSSRSSFAGSTTQLHSVGKVTYFEGLGISVTYIEGLGIFETCEGHQRPASPFARTLRTYSCRRHKKQRRVMGSGTDEQALCCSRDAQFVNFCPRGQRFFGLERFSLQQSREIVEKIRGWGMRCLVKEPLQH
jgi:hypothetical protein